MRFPIKTVFVAAVAAVLLVGLGARAEAKLRVVASIETLADLSRQVGGDRVDVTSLSRGVPGSALRRRETVAGARAQPRGRAGLRGSRSRDRLAAPAGAAGAQRPHPARAAREHRRFDVDPSRRRSERPVRSAARDGRHPPAGQPALLDPAQERPRHRAPARRAVRGARRRTVAPRTGRGWRASRRSSRARRSNGRARRRRCGGRASSRSTRAGRTWRAGSGWRRSATSSPSPVSRRRRITPRSSSR